MNWPQDLGKPKGKQKTIGISARTPAGRGKDQTPIGVKQLKEIHHSIYGYFGERKWSQGRSENEIVNREIQGKKPMKAYVSGRK